MTRLVSALFVDTEVGHAIAISMDRRSGAFEPRKEDIGQSPHLRGSIFFDRGSRDLRSAPQNRRPTVIDVQPFIETRYLLV